MQVRCGRSRRLKQTAPLSLADQSPKLCMAEPSAMRPFDELRFVYSFWFDPNAFAHDLFLARPKSANNGGPPRIVNGRQDEQPYGCGARQSLNNADQQSTTYLTSC